MRNASQKPPTYLRLKRTKGRDLAFVILRGQRTYLGPYGSPESVEKYKRVIAEYKASQGEIGPAPAGLTVIELLNRFRKHLENHYKNPDGTTGREAENYLPAMGILQELCGRMSAAEFAPRELKAVRQIMIERGWTRNHINRQVVRVRTVFKWGVSEGLVPVTVHTALTTVDGLRAGRSEAPESEPVRPVSEQEMRAILPNISPVVGDMILLQWYTGMRPGEVAIMRLVDIDMSGEVWQYRPSRHKCQFRGRERQVPLGPQAQEIIKRHLLGRPVDAFMFSPRESDQWRRMVLHSKRKTPMSCGNVPGSNQSDQPLKVIGECYSTRSYGRAVAYGCEVTWPHPVLSSVKTGKLTKEQKDELRRWNSDHRWAPNQLRHAAATRIRKVAGLEMARAVLGHSTISVTEAYYAEADMQKAAALMKQIG